MKKYLLFSFVLLAAGVFLCVDMRTMRLAKLLEAYNCHSFFKVQKSDYYEKLPDNFRDRKLVEAYFSAPKGYEKLGSLIDDDYAWSAVYAWDLCRQGVFADKKTEKKLTEILSKMRKLDPDNGCPDYIEAVLHYQKAVKYAFAGKEFTNKLLDRQSLEKSAYFYMQAISKPYVKIYNAERSTYIVSLLGLKNDMLGTIQRITVNSMGLLSHLNSLRELARMAVFYAQVLDKDGKKAERRRILRSGRDFVRQWAKDNSDMLIEYLVYAAIIGEFHKSAQKLNDKEMIAFYGRIVDDLQKWKSNKKRASLLAIRYGGYCSSMITPAMPADIPIETFTPERKLTYLVFDRLVLAGFAVFCVLIVFYLSIGTAVGKLCRKEVRLIKFSCQSWLKIIGIGMFLPIGVFLVFSRIDAIGGRDFSFYVNKIGLWGSLGLLGIMWLFTAATLRIEIRKAGKINFASHCLSKILPYALFVFIAGAVLGIWFEFEEKFYLRRDTIIYTDRGLSGIENKIVQERTGKLLDFLK